MSMPNLESEQTAPFSPDAAHTRLAKWVGSWKGTARTTFEPGAEPIEAPWEGQVTSLLSGRFVRFTYRSTVQEKAIAGELTVAFESGEKLWRTAWIDSFHTGTAILVSEGAPEEDDGSGTIDVRGSYFAAEGHPYWGWRTEINDARPDALHIRMFNIEPEGKEDLGVELLLERASA